MRLPTRKSEQQRRQLQDDGPAYLTKEGIEKLKRKITRIEKELPEVTAEVQRTREMGDLSENAAYQQAKHQMRRMQGQLLHLKERLKNTVEIKKESTDMVQLGSTVKVKIGDEEKIFEIVGPLETDPTNGRISNVSPLGSLIAGKRVGEKTELPNGVTVTILHIE